jgi:hypothetical protein
MAASSTPNPTATPGVDASATTGLDRIIGGTFGRAKSWVGLMTAYFVASAAAITAFSQLPEPFKSAPLWLRITLISALPVLALVFQAIPELIERNRKNRLMEITGHLQAGYFQLAPRENEASFTRHDGVHEEILRWIEQRTGSVLYLTGLSGSGKSSLLAAWVVPRLQRKDTIVIRLRGYQDPVAVLEQELLRPGVIWQKPTAETGGVRPLIAHVSRYIRPKRLLVVLDQFEEFVILQDPDKQKRFEQLLSDLGKQPIPGLTFLLVFRSDYIGLIEKLALPPLNQNTNWKEVPPFTESAARDFMQGSGLQVSDELLRDVLREAAEIEQTKGIIRPVTINLCGLVLGRFTTGLPRGLRPGGLIRGFLRESILLPPIRDIAPVLVPHLITGYITKCPRSIPELATETANDPAAVRGCLRVLGQSERAIVRPLDAGQQVWEISHDFLVPLLDSIVARWRVSLWRRLRPWLPWIAATTMVVAVMVAANWRRDPILDLEDLGWKVHKTGKVLELEFNGTPPRSSLKALQRISQPQVKLNNLDGISTISEWTVPENLTALDLGGNLKVSDLSPLKDLKNLTTLDIHDTLVSDLSPLKDLKNLTRLDLSYTVVSDLSPLKDLKNLTRLDLSYDHRVSDLSPLKDLKNLTTLNLIANGGGVSDLSPLKDLENLTTLNLSFNHRISDLSPLKDLKNLTTLNLYDATGVSDLSPLKDLENLTTLNVIGTGVRDLSPLKDLKNLKNLTSYILPR